MATGVARLPPAIRRSLVRSLSSSLTSSPITLTAEKQPEASASTAPILDISDTEQLFSTLPTSSLLRSLSVLSAVAVEPLVDAGIAVMQSSALLNNRVTKKMMMAAVKATVYRYFCAGEDLEEAGRTLRRLWEAGLRGILEYGQEDAEDDEACDRNLAEFLNAVATTSSLPASSVSFACVKITAICPISLLERVSDLLRWQQTHPSLYLPWMHQSLPVLVPSSPLYHTPSPPAPLTAIEEHGLQLAHDRLSALCHRCADANLPLLVDAEYTSVQPAIDYITFSAATEFNGDGRALVHATIQAYLKDSKDRMVAAIEAAERAGVAVGFKLVRGAYLTRESREAAALGAASPVHGSIEETHRCYNECAAVMMERVARGGASVVLATHNFESVWLRPKTDSLNHGYRPTFHIPGKVAAAKAEELGIRKGDEKLQFSQLMGMADGLSLALRNAGFQVSKYLPFGRVEQVMPYLLRRAEENRGLLSSSTLDRELIRKELKRRLKAPILRRSLR